MPTSPSRPRTCWRSSSAVAADRPLLARPGRGARRTRLDDGTVYDQPGKLLFSDASVDATTGQVTLRAEFPNPKGDLLPGMYVRVRLEQAVRQARRRPFPQHADRADRDGPAAGLCRRADDKVAQARNIKLGRALGSDWMVDGRPRRPARRSMVDGFQKMRPGGKVACPKPWKPASDRPSRGIRDREQGGRVNQIMAQFFIDRPIFAWVIALFIIDRGRASRSRSCRSRSTRPSRRRRS